MRKGTAVKSLSPFARLVRWCGIEAGRDPVQKLKSALKKVDRIRDKASRQAAISRFHEAGALSAEQSSGNGLVEAIKGLVMVADVAEPGSAQQLAILSDALNHTQKLINQFAMRALSLEADIAGRLGPCTALERKAARSFRNHLEMVESDLGKVAAFSLARVHGENAGLASSIRAYAGDFLREHRQPDSDFVKFMPPILEGEVPPPLVRRTGSTNMRPFIP
jgi:hypothetical protein